MKSDKRLISGHDASGRGVEFNLGAIFTVSIVCLALLSTQAQGPRYAAIEPLGGALSGYLSPIAILGFVLLNAAFKAAEASLELIRPFHLRAVKDANPAAGAKLQLLFDQQTRHKAALTLGSHSCTVALVFLAFIPAPSVAQWVAPIFGWSDGYGTVLLCAIAVALPVVLLNVILGELIPRSYATLHPHRVALRLNRFVIVTTAVFLVPAKILSATAGVITARFGGKASFELQNQAEEEIKGIVESAEVSGEIESDEKELLHSVFEFTDTVAREVMTPRVDMDAMPLTSTATDVLQVIQRTGHSRIPLYEDTDDQIVGIVHAKDLLVAVLSKNHDVNLRTLMRPALFVPENKDLHELLTEMRQHRTQMAVVQDEYGGTAGVVTTEDIVEELVGDIVDEYDVEEAPIKETESGHEVEGKLHIDDVNDAIGSDLSSEEFDTLGGYVFGLFGRQPHLNESIEDDEYRFTVTMTDGRRIQRVRIERVDATDSTKGAE